MHDEPFLEKVLADAIAERKGQMVELQKEIAGLELARRIIHTRLDQVAAKDCTTLSPEGSTLASGPTTQRIAKAEVAAGTPPAAVAAAPTENNGGHLAGRKWPIPICDAAERVLVEVGRALTVDEILTCLAPLGLTPSHSSVETALRKDKKRRFTKIASNTFRLAEAGEAVVAVQYPTDSEGMAGLRIDDCSFRAGE